MVDDELSVESEQILVHSLEQSRDQNHSQVVSRHLVDLSVHLDPGGQGRRQRGVSQQVCLLLIKRISPHVPIKLTSADSKWFISVNTSTDALTGSCPHT